MTWDEFLVRREDFIGRDIFTDEKTVFCRGPLRYVVGQQKTVHFHLKWIAFSEDNELWWIENQRRKMSLNMDYASSPREQSDSIIIDVPYLGTFVILPEGDHLNPDDCIWLSNPERTD